VPAFTDCLNNPDNEHHVPGALVVAAVKGGSPDMPASADRVEGYTQQLVNDYDVTIYDTVGETPSFWRASMAAPTSRRRPP
jgi:hypothetical protein